jgi:hypothetical protein
MEMAMPYKYTNGNQVPYGHYIYYDYPDGMLKTSTIQLARFLIAFMQDGKYGNARILDSTTVRLILTPQIPVINPDQGLTWMKIYLGSRVFWGHTGGDYGIRTRMYYCPNDTTGALLFVNAEFNPGYDQILIEMFNYAENYITAIKPLSSNIPKDFILYQNYPNPFNSMTKIQFEVTSVGQSSQTVTLKVFDLLGREVKTLVNEKLQPGIYEVSFDAGNLPSGTYFYKLTAGEFTDTKRMILIK